jgi:predicted amidophosphoribosyltransferase
MISKDNSMRLLKRLLVHKIIIHMLCRSCGQELDSIRTCAMCKETVQWKCFACNKEGDSSIHVHAGTISASMPTGRTSEV